MNKKYLFGMLFSGAMLAACTADDFDTAPVVKDVNPSAPVFTVSFEDGGIQNRAAYNDGRRTLDWKLGDQMSLFHGIISTNPTGQNGLAGWQNAVYKADVDENTQAESGLNFTTAAMVQPGLAVMVYPADVAFSNPTNSTTNLGTNNPVVTIKPVQGPEDKNNIPFISEVLEITKTGRAGNNSSNAVGTAGVAGYEKEYEIAMKRAAATLQLVLKKDNLPEIKDADVAELTVKSVTIDLGENSTRRTELANTRPFSLMLPVAATEAINEGSDFGKAHKTWRYRTSLDLTYENRNGTEAKDKESSWSLKTTDVAKGTATADNDTVTFTILPNSSAGGSQKGGDVIVETNYGFVTITNGAELFGSKTEATFMEAFENIMPQLWYTGNKQGENSIFKDEYRGGYARTSVLVDMDSLDMNGMHIQTDKELSDAIKVYKSLYAEKEGAERDVVFNLDGNSSNTFNMTAETMALVVEQMEATNKAGHGLKFQACQATHPKVCQKIKITQSGATAAEVPSTLLFETTAVEVQLAGNWTFSSVTKLATDNTDKAKVMVKVSQLTVLGTLELQNNVVVKESVGAASVSTMGIVVETTGTVNVKGKVYLHNNLTNKGLIEIKKEKNGLYNVNELLLKSNVTLTNMEPTVTKADGTDITNGWDEGAKIKNGGTLGTLQGETNTNILNYGIIEVDGVDASTEVTNNGDVTADANNVFKHNQSSGDNRIGSIVLNDPKASKEKTTVTGTQKGFIKITITKSQAEAKDYGQVANYAIIADGCEEVYVGEKKVGNATTTYMPENILYIEVANTKQEVRFEGMETENSTPNAKEYTAFDLKGLFVKSGAFLTIPEITTVNLDGQGTAPNYTSYNGKIYNAGRIDAKGKLNFSATNGTTSGYYGNGNGEIVTGK